MESRLATWAGVEFYWSGLSDEASQQTASRVAQGVEGQRIDAVGILPKYWTSFQGGMVRRGGLHPDTDLNQVWYNQGLQTHIPYQLTLPYALTTQATLTAVDHSGFRAANKRVHAAIFNSRFVACIGTQLFKDTSTTDPTLTVPATADGITDLVTALWNGMVGTTPALFKGCDGTTDDIEYTTDPYADTVSWTKFVTLSNAADYVSAAQYFPALGGGYHVMIGRIGNDPTAANGVWYVSKDASLPATALQVVYEDTKDVEGSNTTVTTSAISPASAAMGRLGDTGQPSFLPTAHWAYQYANQWSSTANIVSSNDTYATATWNHFAEGDGDGTVTSPSGARSDEIVATDFDLSTLPDGAIPTGYQVEIEAHESSSSDEIRWSSVQLYVNGSAVGVNMADGTEVTSSTNTYKTFGGSTSRFGIGSGVTGKDLKTGLSIGIQFAGFETVSDSSGLGGGTSGTAQINVDHVRVTITYRIPGAQVKLASGGFTPGPWASKPNTLVYIEPESDDETGITKSRRLVFINLEYDAEGDRVVASVEYPDTGLSYIEDAWYGAGGLFVCGNKSSGLGKQVKHIDANGAVRQYQFPGFHGTNAVGVVMGFDEGNTSLIEVANEDATETQWWRLVDTAWHASTPLQSKSNAIASLPLAWAERTLHRPQNHAYRFFPVSTTHLAAARMFVPRNPMNDVLSTNTTQTKHNGPLYLITPEFELGNFENETSLMLVRHAGRQISATGGSFGTVTYDFEVSTDSTSIDTTFASPDVTTGALDAAFEEYQVPGAGKPYRTIQGRVTLNNASASTKTPNGVPFYTEIVTSRPHLSQLTVYVDWAKTGYGSTDWLNFVDRLLTASATAPVNALEIGGIGKTAQLVGWTSKWDAEDIEQSLREPSKDAKGRPNAPWLRFRAVRGTV
jgi:hypothetical protein